MSYLYWSSWFYFFFIYNVLSCHSGLISKIHYFCTVVHMNCRKGIEISATLLWNHLVIYDYYAVRYTTKHSCSGRIVSWDVIPTIYDKIVLVEWSSISFLHTQASNSDIWNSFTGTGCKPKRHYKVNMFS